MVWLGDKLNDGLVSAIEHTHYYKVIAHVLYEDGSKVKYLVKEGNIVKNEVYKY